MPPMFSWMVAWELPKFPWAALISRGGGGPPFLLMDGELPGEWRGEAPADKEPVRWVNRENGSIHLCL